MMNPLSLEELLQMRGQPVTDVDGEAFGTIVEVYYDRATHLPEWIGVSSGDKRLVVPLFEAVANASGLKVPYQRELIEGTPTLDEREIDEEVERQLYEHFGIAYSSHSSPTLLPDAMEVSVTDVEDSEPIETEMHVATRWSWPEESPAPPPPHQHGTMPESDPAGAPEKLTLENAAPFPTTQPDQEQPLEPEAAPSAEHADVGERELVGATPLAGGAEASLDDASVVMTDMPADVPGTLHDTTPMATPSRSTRMSRMRPALMAAAAVGVTALMVRRFSRPDDE